MRSSDEHYENILAKAEERRGERMIKRKRVIGAVSCLAVVLVAGLVVSQLDVFEKGDDSEAQYAQDVDLDWSKDTDGGDYGDDGAEDGAAYWEDEEIATDDAGNEGADIAYTDEEQLMLYYIPNGDGTYTQVQESLITEEDGETSEEDITLSDAVIRYFELCKENGFAEDVTLDSVETDTVDGTEKSNGDGTVSYMVGYSTAYIYLEGETSADEVFVGLVNTVNNSTVIADGFYRYVKLYLNGEAVSINGDCPEEGFENFDIEVVVY